MRTAYLVSLVLSVCLALIYLFQDRYTEFMYFFSNAFPPFIAGAAAIVSGLALIKYWGNPGDKFFQIWAGFHFGMTLWFLGEVSWAVYTLFLNVEIPYPSIADVAWLVGYVPLIAAIELYLRAFRFAISKAMYAVAAVAVSIGSFILFTFLVSPILAVTAEKEITTLVVDIAYPALDLVLLSLSILSLLVFAKGKIALTWLLINGAILLNVAADMLFSYTTLQGTYYNGHFLELFFHWGYILFALAFYTHRKEL